VTGSCHLVLIQIAMHIYEITFPTSKNAAHTAKPPSSPARTLSWIYFLRTLPDTTMKAINIESDLITEFHMLQQPTRIISGPLQTALVMELFHRLFPQESPTSKTSPDQPQPDVETNGSLWHIATLP
jgi:hypothetical protein